jgi:hypothetical protein
LQPLWNPGKTGLSYKIFMKRAETTTSTGRTDLHPNEDNDCKDEAAPWGRSNHLMGTKLLPSRDDNGSFSSP